MNLCDVIVINLQHIPRDAFAVFIVERTEPSNRKVLMPTRGIIHHFHFLITASIIGIRHIENTFCTVCTVCTLAVLAILTLAALVDFAMAPVGSPLMPVSSYICHRIRLSSCHGAISRQIPPRDISSLRYLTTRFSPLSLHHFIFHSLIFTARHTRKDVRKQIPLLRIPSCRHPLMPCFMASHDFLL